LAGFLKFFHQEVGGGERFASLACEMILQIGFAGSIYVSIASGLERSPRPAVLPAKYLD
jgi:hypothetical protein